LVGRCSICHNLWMIFCSITCHMFAVESSPTTWHQSTHNSWIGYKFYWSRQSAGILNLRYLCMTEMYDSCKEVTNPSSNCFKQPWYADYLWPVGRGLLSSEVWKVYFESIFN
jgi:Niemann-Pick C1 protein